MIPLGMLGQIYAICAGIGSIFLIGSFALGHVEGEGAHHGGDDGGSDFSAGDDGGGSDFGAGDDGGGSDFGAGDDGSAGGTDFNAGGNGNSHYKVAPLPGHRGVIAQRGTGSSIAAGVGGMLLNLLSPMTISVYLCFFGLTGLLLAFNAPWLGYLTLIPAIAVSILISNSFKAMTKWMIHNLHSSTHQKESDLLGQLAEVNVPISDGRTGEVTYVLNAKRMTASAKPAKAGQDFKRGSKVMIVGSKEHVVFIEPYESDELENRFIS